MMTTNCLHVSPPCSSHLKNISQRSLHKSTRTSSFLSSPEQYSLTWTCHTFDLFSVLLMGFWVFPSVLRFKVVFLYQEISLRKSFSHLLLVYLWHQNPRSGNCSTNEQICIHYFQILPNPLPSVVPFACPMTLQEHGCFLLVSPQRMLSSGFISISQLKKGFSTWFQCEFLVWLFFTQLRGNSVPLTWSLFINILEAPFANNSIFSHFLGC